MIWGPLAPIEAGCAQLHQRGTERLVGQRAFQQLVHALLATPSMINYLLSVTAWFTEGDRANASTRVPRGESHTQTIIGLLSLVSTPPPNTYKNKRRNTRNGCKLSRKWPDIEDIQGNERISLRAINQG